MSWMRLAFFILEFAPKALSLGRELFKLIEEVPRKDQKKAKGYIKSTIDDIHKDIRQDRGHPE